MNGQPPKEPTPEEEEEEDEDDEEDEEEEEEYDEKEEVKEEPVKLREMPRRVTIMGKEPVRFQSPEQTPKRRRRESESVEEAKEEVEDEEDEEFDQLEEGVSSYGVFICIFRGKESHECDKGRRVGYWLGVGHSSTGGGRQ